MNKRLLYYLSLFVGANAVFLAWSLWPQHSGWFRRAYNVFMAVAGGGLVLYTLWRGRRGDSRRPPAE